ncbi:MAG TPA: WD40 repeat domain-containing protein, partial [Anaerolineales bacterium]|nr:WD40 repeat domain-containing protein [Anaerolineales bacterium]
SAVSFSPDGTRLVTGSYQDGTVRVYLLRIEDLVALARTRLTRWFTLPECRQYLHTEQCPAGP